MKFENLYQKVKSDKFSPVVPHQELPDPQPNYTKRRLVGISAYAAYFWILLNPEERDLTTSLAVLFTLISSVYLFCAQEEKAKPLARQRYEHFNFFVVDQQNTRSIAQEQLDYLEAHKL